MLENILYWLITYSIAYFKVVIFHTVHYNIVVDEFKQVFCFF